MGKPFKSKHIAIKKLCLIILLVYSCTPGYSNRADKLEDMIREINHYANEGQDTAFVLLEKITPLVDLNLRNEQSFKYYLCKLNAYNSLNRRRDAIDLLEIIESYYQDSYSSDLILLYDLIKLKISNRDKNGNADYLNESINIHDRALEINNQLYIIDAKINLAYAYHDKLNHKESKRVLDEALDLAEIHGYTNSKAKIYFTKGSFEQEYSNFENGLEYVSIAQNIYKQIGNYSGRADADIAIAFIYSSQGLYTKSLNNYRQALAYFEKISQKYRTGLIYNNIGVLYQKMGDYTGAIEFFKEAKDYVGPHNDERLISFINTNIGNSYTEIGEFERAKTFLLEGLEAKIKLDNIHSLAYSYNSLGRLYLLKNQLDESETQYINALNRGKETSSKKSQLESFIGLAEISLLKGDIEKAKANCEEALKLSNEINVLDGKRKVTEILSKIFQEEGSFKKALEYYRQSVILRDSMINFDNALQLADMQSKYENEKEILNLKLDNQEKNTSLLASKSRTRLLLLGLVSFILLSLISIWNYFQKQQANFILSNLNSELNNTNQKLNESNRQLEQFAHVASHDLKSPLRTIISFTGLLKKQTANVLNESQNTYLDYIIKSGKNLSELLDDLLAFSKIDSQNINVSQNNGNELINTVINSLSKQAEDNNVSLIQTNEIPKLIEVDSIKLNRVFQNIISNAIKFSDPHKESYVKIKYEDIDNEFHHFVIEDNGMGIKKTDRDIFQPFTYLNSRDNYSGTGMGLAICKKIINKHGGEIWYSSEENIGTTFYFTISKKLTKMKKLLETSIAA